MKDRIPHKENRGITIVAKPATKVVVFLAAILVGVTILLAVNALVYGF